MKRTEFTIKDKLRDDVNEYKHYLVLMSETRKNIEHGARELLCELRKIKGWECMIRNCVEQYNKYPDKFFNWCSVTHNEDAVQFVKGYSNGEEYKVLEISYRKSLEEQVQEKINYQKEQSEKKKKEERERDFKQLEHIIRKYGS